MVPGTTMAGLVAVGSEPDNELEPHELGGRALSTSAPARARSAHKERSAAGAGAAGTRGDHRTL